MSRPPRDRMSLGAAFVLALLALLTAAPTAGDIGGCGAEVEALDVERFAGDERTLVCQKCASCRLLTTRCTLACNGNPAANAPLPSDCVPLVHDGAVCLRAIDEADCSAFAQYVADRSPSMPGECAFCKKKADASAEAKAIGEAGP